MKLFFLKTKINILLYRIVVYRKYFSIQMLIPILHERNEMLEPHSLLPSELVFRKENNYFPLDEIGTQETVEFERGSKESVMMIIAIIVMANLDETGSVLSTFLWIFLF